MKSGLKPIYGYDPIAEDFCSEALVQILAYPGDLRTGPEPVSVRTSEWYDQVEGALRRLARSMKGAVYRAVYSGGGRNHIGGDDLNEIPDPDSNLAHAWFEEGQHWRRDYMLLHKLLQEQAGVDELEIQILDALYRNAVRDGAVPNAEEVFRGDTFQIVHKPLLATLQASFPESHWEGEKLRVMLARLCRHAVEIQKDT